LALYEHQRHVLLKRFRQVILLLDGDSTGRKASTVIAHTLRPQCSLRVVFLPDGVQPDQLTTKDIAEILPSAANDD
jgi:DNA primase